MIRLTLLASLVLLALPLHAQRATITPTLIVDFGGITDDPATEMLRVDGVLRMPGGQFVVANGKPPELRVYDARGRMLRVISRRGGGPGEYQYGVTVRPWKGDTLLAFTQGNNRWLLFGLDGKLVREWPATEQSPRPQTGVLLHGSAIINRSVIGSAGCPRAAIERHAPRTSSAMHEAVADPAGRLWLRTLGGTDWTVYDHVGTSEARYRLPAGFTLMQFDGDLVVGVYHDEDGFPHVAMFRTGLRVHPAASTSDCSSIPMPVEKTRAAEIKTAMRNAMTYSEAHYSRNQTYPAEVGDFPSQLKPAGTDFVVHSADAEHYAYSLIDKATGWRCMVRVGKGNPAIDGVLLCGS